MIRVNEIREGTYKETPRIPEEFPAAIICLSSGKGGVGKTSITVNLGILLADMGYRTLIVDGDMGLANIDVVMGISVRSSIRDILVNEGDPMETVVQVSSNLYVLPASSGMPEMVSVGPEEQELLEEALLSISSNFHFVLIDSAAGIGSAVLWFNSFAQYNVVVLTPDPTSLTDAYALIKVLHRDYQRERFHLILNLVKNDREGGQVGDGINRVINKFLGLSPDCLGHIPMDHEVRKAVREQMPFIKEKPDCRASVAMREIVQKVEGWGSQMRV